MKIKIEQEHIISGEKKSCTKCPIALAFCAVGLCDARILFTRQRGVEDDPRYGYFRTTVSFGPPGNKVFSLPIECSDFVAAFDEGIPVVPFEFEFNTERGKAH